MDCKKPNKIREIVRLQQILKKWRKLANAPKASTSTSTSTSTRRGMKFLRRTLSAGDVPKGFLAVCVGEELKRFVIPTEYLGHSAFTILLREAEEEFGFQQEGVLRIPCQVSVFEKTLKLVREKREVFFMSELGFGGEKEFSGCCSSEADMSICYLPQKPLCR